LTNFFNFLNGNLAYFRPVSSFFSDELQSLYYEITVSDPDDVAFADFLNRRSRIGNRLNIDPAAILPPRKAARQAWGCGSI
jgi:hypothetical protein